MSHDKESEVMAPSPLVGEEQGGSVPVRGNEQDRFDLAIVLHESTDHRSIPRFFGKMAFRKPTGEFHPGSQSMATVETLEAQQAMQPEGLYEVANRQIHEKPAMTRTANTDTAGWQLCKVLDGGSGVPGSQEALTVCPKTVAEPEKKGTGSESARCLSPFSRAQRQGQRALQGQTLRDLFPEQA